MDVIVSESSSSLPSLSDQWPKQTPPNGLQCIIQSIAALSPFRSLSSITDHSSMTASDYRLKDWDLSLFPRDRRMIDEEDVPLIKTIISYESMVTDPKQNVKKKDKARNMTEDYMQILLKMLGMCFPRAMAVDDPIFVSDELIDLYGRHLVIKALCSTFSQAVALKFFRDWLFGDVDRYADFCEMMRRIWQWISNVCSDPFHETIVQNKQTKASDHRNSTVKELILWTSDIFEGLFVEDRDQMITQLQKPLLPLMMNVISQKNVPKADVFTLFREFSFTRQSSMNVYSVELIKNYNTLVSLLRGAVQCKNFEDLSTGIFVFRYTLGVALETKAIDDDIALQRLAALFLISFPSPESLQKMFSLLKSSTANVGEEVMNIEFSRFIQQWIEIDSKELLHHPSPAISRCAVQAPDDDDQQQSILFLFEDNLSTIDPQSGEIQITMDDDELKDFNKKIEGENTIVEIVMKKLTEDEPKDETARIIFPLGDAANERSSQRLMNVLTKVKSAQEQRDSLAIEIETDPGSANEVTDADISEAEDDDDDGRSPSLSSIKPIKIRYDSSFTDDEGGDEMDDEDDVATPNKKSVPLFNQEKNEKKEENDDNVKKIEKKIATKLEASKQKSQIDSSIKQNGKKRQYSKKSEKANDIFAFPDENHLATVDDDENSKKKSSKKSKNDEKTSAAPSMRSSKKTTPIQKQQEKKQDEARVQQRSARLTAIKANEKIRNAAIHEKKSMSDNEDENDQKMPMAIVDHFKTKSTSSAMNDNRKKSAAEKKPLMIKEKKSSIPPMITHEPSHQKDIFLNETLMTPADTIDEKIDTKSSNTLNNFNEGLRENKSSHSPSQYASRTKLSSIDTKSSPYLFHEATKLDDRAKLFQQETMHGVVESINTFSEVLRHNVTQQKSNELTLATFHQITKSALQLSTNADSEWRNTHQQGLKVANKLNLISKMFFTMIIVDNDDHPHTRKRKSISTDDGDLFNKNDLMDDSPVNDDAYTNNKYPRFNDAIDPFPMPSRKYQILPTSKSTAQNKQNHAKNAIRRSDDQMNDNIIDNFFHNIGYR